MKLKAVFYLLGLTILVALPSTVHSNPPAEWKEILMESHIATGREFPYSDVEREALGLAREQLAAYNNCDIDAFLLPFADEIEIYTFPDKLQYKGKELMRERYTPMFAANPELNCEITQEVVFKNYVLHREFVTGLSDGRTIHALCIYAIENGKIARAYFL